MADPDVKKALMAFAKDRTPKNKHVLTGAIIKLGVNPRRVRSIVERLARTEKYGAITRKK